MSIGSTIRHYRKKCGLTQAQVAEAVGVSKPAVSKWESCNAYPDITLLAPLARLLGTTVDSLLEYNMSLTDEEIAEKIAKFSHIFSADGWKEAVSYAERELHQFPNVNELKTSIAQAYFQFAVLTTDAIFQNEIIPRSFELLQQVAKCGDFKEKEIALTHLANNSLLTKQYGQALEAAKQLPQEKVETEILLATIYFHSGDYNLCKLLSQKILFRSYKNCDLSFGLLEKVAWNDKVYEEGLNLFKRHLSFYEIFRVDNRASLLLEIVEIYAKTGDTKRLIDTLNEYIEELRTINETGKHGLFYLLDIEQYKNAELKQASFVKLAEHLSSDTFRDFKSNADFQKIIDILKTEANSMQP